MQVDIPQLDTLFYAVSARLTALETRVEALSVPTPVQPPPTPPVPSQVVLCADPARAYAWWPAGPNRDAALKFISEHVGLTESEAKGCMPGYKGLTWQYELDLTVFTSDAEAKALPDTYFVLNAIGTRWVQHIWNDDRWFWDISNEDVRLYLVGKLVRACQGYDGLFLDEHANITVQKLSDVALLLKQLKNMLGDKFLIVNTSQSSLSSGYIEQVRAAGSFDAELQWSSGAMRGWAFADWKKLIDEVSAAGGISLLTGSIGVNGPHGDYTRELMWRLAAYWMVRGPGVYLDLMSHPADANDVSTPYWCQAMEFDLGKPVGDMVGKDMGGGAIVFSREFEKGWVYLRGQDSWQTVDFGWNSGVTVTLPVSMSLLEVDGTTSVPLSSIALRTADSAILVKP